MANTQSELNSLSRKALATLAIRCARRSQPFFDTWVQQYCEERESVSLRQKMEHLLVFASAEVSAVEEDASTRDPGVLSVINSAVQLARNAINHREAVLLERDDVVESIGWSENITAVGSAIDAVHNAAVSVVTENGVSVAQAAFDAAINAADSGSHGGERDEIRAASEHDLRTLLNLAASELPDLSPSENGLLGSLWPEKEPFWYASSNKIRESFHNLHLRTLADVLASADLEDSDRESNLKAAVLAQQHGMLDSLVVLQAFMDQATQNKGSDSAAFFSRWLTEHSEPPGRTHNVIPEQHLEFAHLDMASRQLRSFARFSMDVEITSDIISTAEVLRNRTRPDKPIHTRHILGASFQAPCGRDGAILAGHLRKSGVNIKSLLEDFLQFLRTEHPNDHISEWESICESIFSFRTLDSGDASRANEDRDLTEEGRGDGSVPSALHDKPAEHDLLGRTDLVDSLAAMCSSDLQGTPFTVALLGEWGSGKSSVFRLLRKKLEEPERKEKFLFASFNAWEYEHTENIAAGLAQEVVRGLTWPSETDFDAIRSAFPRTLLRFSFAAREYSWLFLWALLKVLIPWGLATVLLIRVLPHWNSALDAFSATKDLNSFLLQWSSAIFGSAGAVILYFAGQYLGKDLRQILEHPMSANLMTYLQLPSYGAHLGLIPVLKRHLRHLCEYRLNWNFAQLTWQKLSKVLYRSAVPQFRRRLIVMVDDLDRCSPECVLETFDAIRLVMDIENVIVIVGIDHRIAFSAVAGHYKEFASDNWSSSDIARDYLGKIIQLPITLETPADRSLKVFVAKHLFGMEDEKLTETLSVEGYSEAVRSFPRQKTDKKQPQIEQNATPSQSSSTVASSDNPTIERSSRAPEALKDVRLSSAGNDASSFDTLEEVAKHYGVPQKRLSNWQVQGCPALIRPPYRLAAISKWLDQCEMTSSADEVSHFASLAERFEFRNPRQLIRLRNTYRLSKLLLMKQRNRKPSVSHHDLLKTLFSLEFLYGLPEDERKLYKAIMDGTRATVDSDGEPAPGVRHEIVPILREVGSERLADTRGLISLLVLPKSEERTHRERSNANLL